MSVLRLRNTLKAFLLVHLDSCVCRFEKKSFKSQEEAFEWNVGTVFYSHPSAFVFNSGFDF